ncbi:hypothetical protein [uncultured Roseovarius sp.]|uniref:hypothetical protein n=1 Tax=uncultured Roseovarius sp. TaxID=293344 RepID=UPI0026214189|nr:hypothetical protein [uncultured Roseovarius sp.]
MTDEDRLIDCLVGNRDLLAKNGAEVPSPGLYRKLIRGLLRNAAKTSLGEDARDLVMDAVAPTQEPERLILSGPSFLGTPKMAAGGGTLYSSAEARLGYFHQMFPHDRIEFFFSIRNLASFLPAMYEATNFTSMSEFLRGIDPVEIRWSDMILRLRASYHDMPITIWCNEDTPLIWAEILREMAGLDSMAVLDGEFALLEEIMSEPGMERFKAYVASHPNMTEVQKRRVIAAFLDKFADDDAIEEELDVPGWTEELVDRMTEFYDEDVFAIQRIPGVNMITP